MRGGDFGVGEAGPVLALESEAAVGLLKRSIASPLIVVFLTGGGGGGRAFRAFASEAAVGANKPLEGVFERGDKVGVFVPVSVRADGLAGVTTLEIVLLDAEETIDWPVSCGLSGLAEFAGVKDCLGGVSFEAGLACALAGVPTLFEEMDVGILGADVFITGVLGICGAEMTF